MFRDERYERGSRWSSSLREENRRGFQNLVQPTKFTHLKLMLARPLCARHPRPRDPLSVSACGSGRRKLSVDTPTFAAIDRTASRSDVCCSTCSNTSTTARSRTSRGCLDNRAITLSFTRPGAVRYAGTQKRRSGPQGAHLLGSARRRPPDSCKSEWIVTMRHRDTGDWDAINRMI
jgi:hypothetical protein